jgi:hypothetical protein
LKIYFIISYICTCLPQSSVFFNYTSLDEMGTKIDELEQSINDLKAEMGTETPVKKPDEPKPADSA